MTLIRNASYNLLGSIIPIVVAIITIPIYLAVIGPANFGLLSMAFLILGYFGVFDLGLGRAAARRVATAANEPKIVLQKIVSTAIITNLVFGVVGAACLSIFSYYYFTQFLDAQPFQRAGMLQAVPVLAISVPVTALTGVFSGALDGLGKFKSVNLAITFSAILFHLFPLTLALYGVKDIQWLIAAACVTRFIGVAILAAICIKYFGFIKKPDWTESRLLFRFGGWVAVSTLVGPLMIITDRFVIGALLGPIAVAHYTIPFEIAARSATIPQAFGRALFPQVSQQDNQAMTQRLGVKSSAILASVITPVTILGIFAMRPFLDLWLGSYAVGSVTIGQMLLVAFWANALSYVPLTVIVGGGRPRFVAITHCLELLPYLALLFFLTYSFGIEGAAAAFLIRCVVDYFILGWGSGLLRRIIKTDAIVAAAVSAAFLIAVWVKPGLGMSALLAVILAVPGGLIALRLKG